MYPILFDSAQDRYAVGQFAEAESILEFMTERWDDVKGRTLTYVGDGNNTCHSLIYTATQLGAHIRVCSPEGYEPNSRVGNEAMKRAQQTGTEITLLNDPDHRDSAVFAKRLGRLVPAWHVFTTTRSPRRENMQRDLPPPQLPDRHRCTVR